MNYSNYTVDLIAMVGKSISSLNLLLINCVILGVVDVVIVDCRIIGCNGCYPKKDQVDLCNCVKIQIGKQCILIVG